MCVLIQNWYRFMNSLEGFPFTLFGCQNEAEFLLSCVDYVVPLFMEEADTSNLQRVSSYVGKSVSEIVEVSRCITYTQIYYKQKFLFFLEIVNN